MVLQEKEAIGVTHRPLLLARVTPTPTLTATPDQAVTQTDVVLGLSWEQTIIATIGIAIVGLVAALVFFVRRNSRLGVD